MPATIRCLCYFSQSLIEGSAEAKAAELERILTVARTCNKREGVTGMLMTSEDCFAQILEGTPDAIDKVYGRILRDTRHTGMTVLRDAAVAERAFADWAMRSVSGMSWPRLAGMGPVPLYRRLTMLAAEGAPL